MILRHIAESLGSAKVRERNDALTELEDVNLRSQSIRRSLDRDTCLILIKALAQMINNEANTFIKTSNAQSEIRLVKASHLLKDLVAAMTLSSHVVSKLRIKHYETIIDAITANMIMETIGPEQVLEPVARNCAKALNVLFTSEDIRGHMPPSKYQSVISIVLRCLDLLTTPKGSHFQDADESSNHELLITELLNLFYKFQGPKSTSTLNIFSNCNTPAAIDNYYLRIVNVIINYSANVFNNRETHTIIVIFRILNRCLVDLATVDVKLCYRIYLVGRNLLLQLQSIHFDKLIHEISLFANLIPDIVYLPDFPHIVGDNWNFDDKGRLVDEDSLDSRSSIIVSHSSEDSFSLQDHPPKQKQLEDLLVVLFQLLKNESSGSLTSDSINLPLNPGCKSWFSTQYIELTNTKTTYWLLILGTSKLVDIYYQINSPVLGRAESDTKRRRLTLGFNIRQQLRCFQDTISFLLSLLDNFPLTSMQMISLLYSSYACTLHLTRSTNSVNRMVTKNARLFDALLAQMEAESIETKYWGLLCLYIILSISSDKLIDSSFINTTIKYALEFAKDSRLCKISCTLLNASMSYVADEDILDKLVLQQFDTMLDLSEVNGPALICKESLVFWHRIYTLCDTYSLSAVQLRGSKDLLSSKIGRWLLTRLHQIQDLSEYADIEAACNLVFWVTGSSCTPSLSSSAVTSCDVSLLYEEKSLLREYILMQNRLTIPKSDPIQLTLPTLVVDPAISKSILLSYQEIVHSFCYHSSTKTAFALWIFTLRKDPKFETDSPLQNCQKDLKSLMAFVDAINLIPRTDTDILQQIATTINFQETLSTILGLMRDEPEQADPLDTQMIDNLLRDSPSSNNSEQIQVPTTNIYNYTDLLQSPTYEMRLISFCSRLSDPQSYMEVIFQQGSELQVLACYFEISKWIDSADLSSKDYKAIVGGSMELLERHKTKVYELSVVVLCRLLGSCRWMELDDDEFTSDCYGVYEYFKTLLEKGMLYSERELLEFGNLIGRIIQHHDDSSDFDAKNAITVMASCFAESNNSIKCSLTDIITDLIRYVPKDRFVIYETFIDAFTQPQSSVESSATFNYFLCMISSSSDSLTMAAICNLIEFSQYDQAKAYLKYSLHEVSHLNSIGETDNIFWNFKELIFKYWRSLDLPIEDFPFDILDCEDYSDFIRNYYRELTAIALAFNDKKTVKQIAQVAGNDASSIVEDSMAVAIAMSETKDGIQSKVFKVIEAFLQPTDKAIGRQLVLIVFQLLKFCDCSSEKALIKAIHSHYAITVKGTPDSEDAFTDLLSEFDTSISPGECFALIRKLLSQYNTVDFWDVPTLFYMTSHFLLLLNKSVLFSEKRSYLRRLKVLSFIDSRLFARKEVVGLLAKNIPALLSDSELEPYLTSVLATLLDILVTYNKKGYCQVVVPIVKSLFRLQKKNSPLLELLHQHAANLGDNFLVMAALDLLREGKTDYTWENIIKLLTETDDVDTIVLISDLLPYTDGWEELDVDSLLSQELIQKLFDIKQYPVSGKFKAWIGHCIGRYYLMTGLGPSSPHSEFNISLLNSFRDFDSQVSLLDPVFEQMIATLPEADLDTQLCFNLIAGVIINKSHQPQGLDGLLSYKDLFAKYEEYIYPMDTYISSLANTDTKPNQQLYYNEQLDSALKGFTMTVQQTDFNQWIVKIYFAIVNELNSRSSIVTILTRYICQLPSFAKTSFSSLVMYYVNNENIRKGRMVAKMINDFFAVETPPTEATDLFLELVLLIRIGAKNGNAKFINLNLFLGQETIYRAALRVHKPKTALMLMEDYYLIGSGVPDRDVGDWKATEYEFLSDVYSQIDENDLFFGLPANPTLTCGINFINHNDKKQGSEMFSKAYEYTDILEGKQVQEQMGHDMAYERAWKLNQWDIPAPDNPMTEHQAIYKALKIVQADPINNADACKSVLCQLMDEPKFGDSKSLDNDLQSWYRTLAFLVNMDEILELNSKTTLPYVNDSDKRLTWISKAEAKASSSIILGSAAGYKLLDHVIFDGKIDSESIHGFGVLNELHRYGQLMRLKGNNQDSINAAVYSNRFADKFTEKSTLIHEQMSRIATFDLAASFWSQGEETTFPVVTLKKLVEQGEPKSFPVHCPKLSNGILYAHIATWCLESRQDTPDSIMQQYVEREASKKSNAVVENGQMYYMFAQFCDHQLRGGEMATKISSLRQKATRLHSDLKELEAYAKKDRSSKDARLAFSRLNVSYEETISELRNVQDSKNNYMLKAIEYYMKAIILDAKEENGIDRFCALWLENSDVKLKADYLNRVPAWLFVTWINQLTSRLLNEKTYFQKLLKGLLLRVATEHPFHTAYLLKSLCITMTESSDTAAQSRGRASAGIWKQLLKSESKINIEGTRHVLQSIDMLCDNSVKLANFKLKHRNRKSRLADLPGGDWWLQTLPTLGLPSPVLHLPVKRFGTYNTKTMATMVAVEPYVSSTSTGISQPKIVKVQLSSGVTQKLLLKGGSDDLRQDAIMEQVFEKVNDLWERDDQTRKRKLRIRTYKVISLGTRSGIIEFVTNSAALYDVLRQLHATDTLKIEQARGQMKECQEESKERRTDVFKEITSQIPPVFRMFFFNNFVSPDLWYWSRLMYTRGVATTSIAGYVLGLGDRHCNNILIDKSSGEPIHIDLGVAFDQGKALTIPETVPFRLTRDIVDGMGISGVDGLFSKSCEQALRVLRSHSEYICGILDVLRYDPLYSWTLSPLRKKQLQNFSAGDAPLDKLLRKDSGSEASIAIESVDKKLRADQLGNEAAVRVLIRDATNVGNLATIYAGWCPFL